MNHDILKYIAQISRVMPFSKIGFMAIIIIIAPAVSFSQTNILPASELKKLSMEELMNITVTSVSKSPEKLTEVPSAIQVVTGEDIRRSSVVRLPGALRLASNLQVARPNSHDWAITARGFNGAPLSSNTLANKLLVMIDGRTIYEPILGGVFWDVQNVLLEDVSRIEVVSGPGGSLWGANAVNGVINIISKTAKETQGLYASGGYGSFLQGFGALRYGGKLDTNLYFRIYGQHFDQNSSRRANGNNAQNEWKMSQGGFRMDYLPAAGTTFTIQGDFYKGNEDELSPIYLDGQNLLARWSHAFSPRSGLIVQGYFDRTWRNAPVTSFNTQVHTYDIDIQHQLSLGTRNRFVWGLNYRLIDHEVKNSPQLSFNPNNRNLDVFSGFIQDKIVLAPEKLELTLGTKLLHNEYTGLELQPSVRMAWTPGLKHTVWAAVSRAVRTPARFDTDEITPFISTPFRQFKAEKVVAYELGYRLRPVEALSFSLAGFYNNYRDLRSIDLNLNPGTPIILANNRKGITKGFEISLNAFISNSWRLRGGYTYLYKKLTVTAPTVAPGSDLFEAIDPKNQALFQSIMDLPGRLQLDITGRFIDRLPVSAITPAVPSYYNLDARLAWQGRHLAISLSGENLLKDSHPEFGSLRIPRSIYLNITTRF